MMHFNMAQSGAIGGTGPFQCTDGAGGFPSPRS